MKPLAEPVGRETIGYDHDIYTDILLYLIVFTPIVSFIFLKVVI